ncbi:hypothetical protein B7P43_G10750, partial [Cryptotermes secundus]
MDLGLKKGHKPNPRASANLLSLATFWWVLGIFKLGVKKNLETEDLYETLDEHRSELLGNKLEGLWNEELQQAKAQHAGPSLLRVLVKCFGGSVLWLGLAMAVSEFMFQMTQPIFLGGLIRYFSPGSSVDRDTAYMYAAGVIICSLFNIFCKNPIWLAVYHIGMKMRVGTCSLIYRKALRLSKTALGETTVGQAVNLLSNDVARFDRTFLVMAFLVIAPAETMIIVYLMWGKIGISAVIGVVGILLVIPVQAGFGKMISTLRMRTARRTDERIRFMNEIIVGIQVIKMYAWEK